jgi:hypothetical protein
MTTEMEKCSFMFHSLHIGNREYSAHHDFTNWSHNLNPGGHMTYIKMECQVIKNCLKHIQAQFLQDSKI